MSYQSYYIEMCDKWDLSWPHNNCPGPTICPHSTCIQGWFYPTLEDLLDQIHDLYEDCYYELMGSGDGDSWEFTVYHMNGHSAVTGCGESMKVAVLEALIKSGLL